MPAHGERDGLVIGVDVGGTKVAAFSAVYDFLGGLRRSFAHLAV